MNELTGLVMTGGGARGAYQAGVLKRIGEIKKYKSPKCPFDIIGAASAGSVNAAALAAGAHDFGKNTSWLAQLWGDLRTSDIFRTDVGSLLPKAGHWIKDLTFGAFLGAGAGAGLSLLDATPLNYFLKKHLDIVRIENNIRVGNLKTLAIAATNYNSGKTIFFVQGALSHDLWEKRRQIAIVEKITVDHICASSAIPIVFAPVRLQTSLGRDYYGDGCLRMTTPLSPVIRLKAQKLFAIGVRSAISAPPHKKNTDEIPSLAQILGTSLNAIFMDHLDTDVDHLVRLNNIIKKLVADESTLAQMDGGIQTLKVCSLSPSVDLGRMAESYAKYLPVSVRYMLSGLGSVSSAADLMSYLLFDKSYTRALIDVGYKDAHSRISEIESFFFDA